MSMPSETCSRIACLYTQACASKARSQRSSSIWEDCSDFRPTRNLRSFLRNLRTRRGLSTASVHSDLSHLVRRPLLRSSDKGSGVYLMGTLVVLPSMEKLRTNFSNSTLRRDTVTGRGVGPRAAADEAAHRPTP